MNKYVLYFLYLLNTIYIISQNNIEKNNIFIYIYIRYINI